jgi:hypothetical protein
MLLSFGSHRVRLDHAQQFYVLNCTVVVVVVVVVVAVVDNNDGGGGGNCNDFLTM